MGYGDPFLYLKNMRKVFHCFLSFIFFFTSIVNIAWPVEGVSFSSSLLKPSADFVPVMMRAVKVDPQNPFSLEFFIDQGNTSFELDTPEFKAESEKLIKYFLASLTIKEKDQWVNLSLYEPDKILPKDLSQTLLGRDMLAQDYLLKQLTSSLIYPDQESGKRFWKEIYEKLYQALGTTDIPVDTFSKVWIKAQKAKVLERDGVGYVVNGHLKVLLESDYLAMQTEQQKESSQQDVADELSKDVYRDVIIPVLEKEVNQGEHFVVLRQMFHAMILASWYKQALKNVLLTSIYADQSKVEGIDYASMMQESGLFHPEEIYQQYVKNYTQGVFNFIKEEEDAFSGEMLSRKYFSGGLQILGEPVKHSATLEPEDRLIAIGKMAQVSVHLIDPSQGIVKEPQVVKLSDLKTTKLLLYKKIMRLVQELNNLGIKPLVNRQDLLAFGYDAHAMIQYIQTYTLLRRPQDIYRILSWRLQAEGKPDHYPVLSGITAKDAKNLFGSIFEPGTYLKKINENSSVDIVLFRRGRDRRLTNILKTIPHLNIKVILSGIDDGEGLSEEEQMFGMFGISGAGKALIDLSRDEDINNFCEYRLDSVTLNDFKSFIDRLKSSQLHVVLDKELEVLYDIFMRIETDKRIRLIKSLEKFYEYWQEHQENLKDILYKVSLRSVVLLGTVQMTQGRWQEAMNELSQLLNIRPSDEILFPMKKQGYFIGLGDDGKIYRSAKEIEQYSKENRFIKFWRVSKDVYDQLSLMMSDEKAQIESFLDQNMIQDHVSDHVSDVIKNSDVIVYSGDSLESNIAGALIIPGMKEAIEQAEKAVKINLMRVEKQKEAEGMLLSSQKLVQYITGETIALDDRQTSKYLDYVLMRSIENNVVPTLENHLGKIERVSRGKVRAVSSYGNQQSGPYLAVSFLDALSSLSEMKRSGFEISTLEGVTSLKMVRDGQNEIGLFASQDKVNSLIASIKEHWGQIVEKGAFVFDVDKTILPQGSKGLDDYKELAYLFMQLLRKGVRVAIISGSSLPEQLLRIHHPIQREMKDDVSGLKNLTFYVNGGATKVKFDEQGNVVLVDEYNQTHLMDVRLIKEAINEAFKVFAHRKFGLDPEHIAVFKKAVLEYMSSRKRTENLNVTFDVFDQPSWRPEWLTPEQLAQRNEQHQSLSVPWVEVRGAVGEHYTASLTVSALPETVRRPLRQILRKLILLKFHQAGLDLKNYHIRTGGKTSLDITQSNAEKPSALKDFIEKEQLDPDFVFYIGDEFFNYFGLLGNDESIAMSKDPLVSAVRTIAVNDNHMHGANEKTLWIGRTPQATMEFLSAVTDASQQDIYGGIDLNAQNMMLEIQSDDASLMKPTDLLPSSFYLEHLQGLTPVIFEIKPVAVSSIYSE